MKNKKIIVFISAFIMLISFAVGVFFFKNKEADKFAFIAQKDFSTFVREHSPKLGSLKPKVYLVEFMDPECETCRDFYPLVKKLLEEFEGKVQLVVRYAPFHGNSIEVVKILEAARKQERYWETLEVLFKYLHEWGDHHHPRPDLIWTFLPEAGVHLEQIKADMNSPDIQSNLELDIKDGQTLGVRRTPQFFINGKPLERFGYEPLRQEILNAL